MPTLAFCGLGQMGQPMASRLLAAGHDLVVWNRTPERAAPLVEAGAALATSPAEAASSAVAVFTMLSTPEALEAVVFGPGGVAEGVGQGATLVEMSTVGPAAVRGLVARLPAGVEVLDAPVLGSVPQAREGSLRVFVGGEADTVERWRPTLEAFGRPVHLGPLGAGAAMKLVANSVLGVLMTGLGEALALADGLALDPATVLDLLADSPIGVTVRSKRALIDSGRYPPNFKLSLAAKDLRLVTGAGEAAGVDLRLAPAALAWLEAADASGWGGLDYSSVTAAVRGRPAAG